ncbi:MAG: hypothetical protein JW883_00430 [Deltaproteobacteria bacterium]|nr:hypothetical protein [Deltaproteobacteria bacterium]
MQNYEVVYDGQIAPNHALDQVRVNLASCFKKSKDDIANLFQGRPVVVKKDIDYQTAQKYAAVMLRAGAVCKVKKTVSKTRQLQKIGGRMVVGVEPDRESLSFFPLECPRVTAAPTGIDVHRMDLSEIAVHDIRLLSVFSEDEEENLRVLVFTRNLKRPILIDAAKVQYAEFPDVADENLRSSIRNFVNLLLRTGGQIIVDSHTQEFLEGANPYLPGKSLLSTATALGATLAKIPDSQTETPSDSSSWPLAEERLRVKTRSEADIRREPKVEAVPFTWKELLLNNVRSFGYLVTLVGFRRGLRLLFGFLAEHVRIDGKPLELRPADAFPWPLFYGPAACCVWFLIQFTLVSATKISPLFVIPALVSTFSLPVALGIGFYGLIQWLTEHTFHEGKATCRHLPGKDESTPRFFVSHMGRLYGWGVAVFAFLLGIGIPIFWTVLLREWFARIEIGKYRYHLSLQWDYAMTACFWTPFTLGLAFLKYMENLYVYKIANGRWVPIDADME